MKICVVWSDPMDRIEYGGETEIRIANGDHICPFPIPCFTPIPPQTLKSPPSHIRNSLFIKPT